MQNRVVFHIDFDYFFGQCEELRNPDLKNKPVLVCVFSDRGGDSGAVSTANYVARKYGTKSGMPIKFAKKRLENVADAVFLPTDIAYYKDISRKAMEEIKNISDIFEYVGVDEAYIDVSNQTNSDFDKATDLAKELKAILKENVEITCSIGVSPNKLVSKIASDFEKPAGLTVVKPENIQDFLDPLPVSSIPGIGKKTEKKFSEYGIEKIADAKKLDVFELNRRFGRKAGTYLFNAIRGIDKEPVKQRQDTQQFSRIVTLKEDTSEYEKIVSDLERVCEDLHDKILKEKITFKSVAIQFIQSDLSNKTRSKMLKNPTSNLDELKKNAKALLEEALSDQNTPVRRVGVRVSDISEAEGQDTITKYF